MNLVMMLKAAGIDPEQIQKTIEAFANGVTDLRADMARMEKKLDEVLAKGQDNGHGKINGASV